MAAMFQPEAADEMAGRQRDEPRVFVHLAHHVHRADHAEAARVEQAHLDALFRQRHPRINIGRIIVVVNEDVVALAEIQAGATKLKPSEVGPTSAISSVWQFNNCAASLRASSRRCSMKASWSPSVPCRAHSAIASATRRGSGQTPAWREKNFVARDGKFVAAQFFVGQDFIQRHRAKINCKGSVAKWKSIPVDDVRKVAVWTMRPVQNSMML